MTSMAATLFDFQAAGRQIKLIVEDSDILRCGFVKLSRFAHRLARQVHKCLWLYQQNFLMA